jgi:putative endonuclease
MTLWPFRPKPTFGRLAEILGCEYLRRQGYLLLASPYRASRGEIDIVARDGDFLVFVEVKARRQDPHPEDAVNPEKQRRIIAASREYRTRHPRHASFPYRFDILAVVAPAGRKPEFSLRKDAFRVHGEEFRRYGHDRRSPEGPDTAPAESP